MSESKDTLVHPFIEALLRQGIQVDITYCTTEKSIIFVVWGFFKSGTATLIPRGGNRFEVRTRYGQVDIIESLDELEVIHDGWAEREGADPGDRIHRASLWLSHGIYPSEYE